MIFKSLVDSRYYHSSWDLERHEEPKKHVSDLILQKKRPEKIVYDLDPTEDGETSKKAHCASY